MKSISFAFLAALAGGCLYTGDGTMGLPCNTDLECGGDQLCVEHVCGGPQVGSTGVTEGSSGEESSEGATAQPGDDESVPDSCTPADSECLDADVIRACSEDGKLQTIGCPGVCGEAAPSLGCTESDEGPGCLCGDTRAACDASSEGALDCLDATNLSQCTGGWWQPLDCDSTCVNAGYTGADACGPGDSNDVCFCNTTCQDGARRCVDGATEAQCYGGSWTNYDCRQACIDSGFGGTVGCTFIGAFGGEACVCV